MMSEYRPRSPEDDPEYEGPPPQPWAHTARMVVGWGVVIALPVIAVITLIRASDDSGALSAEQATQIYVEGLLYMVTVIGGAIGIYIATGADD